MPSIYDIKPAFQNLLRPLSNWLARIGVTPNEITIAAVILSLITGVAITCYPAEQWPLLLVPFTLLIRMMLNAIDGMLAREHNMKSALGTFLNEIGDVISDIFIYLPFCLVPGISNILIITIVMLAIIAEMTGVVAVQIAVPRRYDGPMGKSDRAFVFGAIGLFVGCGFEASYWVNMILGIVTILLTVTIINRTTKALRTQHES